jgi:hypothetical protein
LVRPTLWNPNAAANWSLLFSPIFGAYLHATNWRTLGKPEKATANLVWLWVTVAFLVINFGTLFVPQSRAIADFMKIAGIGTLLGWYFTQGRPQATYVNALPGGYLKRSWAAPIGIGAAGLVTYVCAFVIFAMALSRPDPKELAFEVKPLILQEWQKKPELRGASIHNISLVHKGGNVYTGFVDATMGGESVRMSLEVVHDRGTIIWELKPLQ